MSSALIKPWFGLLKSICVNSQRNYAPGVAGIQQLIRISNMDINMEKVGDGPHKIICLPGVLGSIESHFGPQLQNLNREKFTIVAFDPPGCGKSRPPDRDLFNTPPQVMKNDARIGHTLMQKIGFDKFSVLGWSDGAGTGIFMASLFPNSIQKMVLVGGKAFNTDKDVAVCKALRKVDTWSTKMRKPMTDIYGEEYFVNTITTWMDNWLDLYQNKKDDNICRNELPIVKCPTFIIHGGKDDICHISHAEYLHKHIKNSKLYILPEGGHNLHLSHANEFSPIIEEFFDEGLVRPNNFNDLSPN